MYTDGSAGEYAEGALSAAWAQVAAPVAAIDAALNRWLADRYRLGLTEYRAALHLSRALDRELRIAELAEKVGLNQSSATRLVGRMEAKGLVSRDTCPDDGRGVYAVITAAGLGLVAEIGGSYEGKLHDLLRSAATQRLKRNLEVIQRAAGETPEAR